MNLPVALLAFTLPITTLAIGQERDLSVPNACGANSVKFEVQQEKVPVTLVAPPDKALVFVIAQGSYTDKPEHCGIKSRVGLDGHWIGANCEHSYLVFAVEPGDHHLCSNWQTKVYYHPQPESLIGFNAKAGKVYFFRASIDYDKFAPLPIDLELAKPDEARLLLSTALLSRSQPSK